MKIRFWGVRGSIPSPGPKTVKYGGNTACLEVEAEIPQTIILDAGTGIRELGLKLASRPPMDIHLLISHTHWDHIHGFPFFIPAFMPQHKITIYGPVNFNDSLKDIMSRQMDYSYYPVKLGELQAQLEFVELKEGEFKIGDVTVKTLYLNHPVFNLSYSLELGGKKFVYQTDHEPYYNLFDEGGESGEDINGFVTDMNNKIVDFCKGADLLVVDAQYTPKEYDSHRGWGHSSTHHVVERGGSAGVKKMYITHHDPVHTDAFLEKQILAGAEVHKEEKKFTDLEIHLAQEGLEVEI